MRKFIVTSLTVAFLGEYLKKQVLMNRNMTISTDANGHSSFKKAKRLHNGSSKNTYELLIDVRNSDLLCGVFIEKTRAEGQRSVLSITSGATVHLTRTGLVVMDAKGHETPDFRFRNIEFSDPSTVFKKVVRWAKNIHKPVIRLNHADLKRVGSSIHESYCPKCKDGILLMRRDDQTLLLRNSDMCIACGQKFLYEDIPDNSLFSLYVRKYRLGNQSKEYALVTDYLGWIPEECLDWDEYFNKTTRLLDQKPTSGEEFTLVHNDKSVTFIADHRIIKDAFPLKFFGEDRAQNWWRFCIVSLKEKPQEQFIIPLH